VALASLMVHNILDLILLFTLNDIWWWMISLVNRGMKAITD
jgi:hypothetical protein